MSREISIRNLQIIAALNSITYGMIVFISPYILQLGGSHVALGILAVSTLLGELISPEVTKLLTHIHGRKYTLFLLLNTALVTHIMMVLTGSVSFTILVRTIFSITKQSQNICQELLLNKAPDEEAKAQLRKNYSILSGVGYILGPVISGYIFDHGFGYTGLLAALLCFINVNLLMQVTKDSNDSNQEPEDTAVIEKVISTVTETVGEFKKCQPEQNWDLLLLKYSFTGSVLIFFSKFPQILKYNYHSSNVTVGYTASYINSVVFIATYYLPTLKLKLDKHPLAYQSQMSFLAIVAFMLAVCYAPIYELYLVLLVPVIFIRAFIVSIWNELFAQRKNDSLKKLSNAASIVAGLTVPILFGIVCNQIAHRAVILFSCLPLFMCWMILRRHTKPEESTDENESDKKDL